MANTLLTIPANEIQKGDIIEIQKMAYRVVEAASSSSRTFVQLPTGAVEILEITDQIQVIRSI